MELMRFIQSFANPFLDMFFEWITMTGETSFFVIIVSLIYWCFDKQFGYRLGFTILSNGILNTAIKETLKVPRPIGQPGIRSLRVETATGYSFPSGHTQTAAAFWATQMLRIKASRIYVIGGIFMFLVALSRVYLGVHTPWDVTAGLIFGILWTWVMYRFFDQVEKSGQKQRLLIFVIPAFIGLAVFASEDYYKAVGTFAAFYLGYIIEPAYIRFNTAASPLNQIIKFITGLGGIMVFRLGLGALLPQSLFSDFVRYFVLGAWITMGAPYLFKIMLGESAKKQISA